MPPQQPPSLTYDEAAIPFADLNTTPNSKFFDIDHSFHNQSHPSPPPPPPPPSSAPHHNHTSHQQQLQPLFAQPSAADIDALFGLSPAPSPVPTPAPVRTPAPAQAPTPATAPTLSVTPIPTGALGQNISAHYHTLHHSNRTPSPAPAPAPPPPVSRVSTQRQDTVSPPGWPAKQPSQANPTTHCHSIPAAPAPRQTFIPSSTAAPTIERTGTSTYSNTPFNRPMHRYPNYTTSTPDNAPQPQTLTLQQASAYQQPSSTDPNLSFQSTCTTAQHGVNQHPGYEPTQYNPDNHSMYSTTPYSVYPEESTAPQSSGIYFHTSDGAVRPDRGGIGCASNQANANSFTRAAVSYVSSTLAVTSTFASEKFATASSRIADLWQHNQSILPQQQMQQHMQQQMHQQTQQHHLQQSFHGQLLHPYEYEHGQAAVHEPINSGQGSLSYDGHTTSYNGGGAFDPRQYQQQQALQQEQLQHPPLQQHTSFAAAASTLSSAASVAGSYLPSLPKKLPAFPALPWGSGRDKHLQLPQQDPQSLQDQQQHQQSAYAWAPDHQVGYAQFRDDEQAPQHLDYSYPNQYSQEGIVAQSQYHRMGEGLLVGAGSLWGGLRSEVQRGRRIVETGVQVGVAWWWDSDPKNPLRNVV